MSDLTVVRLPALVGGQRAAWLALVELAPRLGDHWLLVGGQMVFLHEVERQSRDTRPTDDLDVVVDLRIEPSGLDRAHAALGLCGFDQLMPNADGIAHRYRRKGAIIDVLAPDHLGARANLRLGSGRTIAAPGTSQALARAEFVMVEVDRGLRVLVRRPTLVAALLGKVAAATQIVAQPRAGIAKHLRDVDSLARLLGADDGAGSNLIRKEQLALRQLADDPHVGLSELARRAINLLAA